MNNEEVFKIRAYGFNELAHIYLPTITKKSATNQLSIWINENHRLKEKLTEIGYRKGNKLLTPAQVKEIIEELGYP